MSVATPQAASVVPEWVVDQESFRRWARSDDYPERGQFSWLGDELWTDLESEELFTHNLVKSEFTRVVGTVAHENADGYFMSDRMLFSHPDAGLSTEPDGMFVFHEEIFRAAFRLATGVDPLGRPKFTLETMR